MSTKVKKNMFKIENHYYVIKHNIYIMDDEMG